MKKYPIVILYLIVILLYSCTVGSNKERVNEIKQEVNVYTHRHYAPDKELFARFEKEQNIKVNVINASAGTKVVPKCRATSDMHSGINSKHRNIKACNRTQ